MLSPLKSSSIRKTIGVFASHVGREWGAEFMAGIAAAAEENDVNLVYFIGGKLIPLQDPEQDKVSYGLYDLARADLLDGLMLTADVAYGVSPEELKLFADLFRGVPIVTQAVDIEGASMFVADNVQGMRAAVRHLIETHSFKRIAFIRGIEGQVDAEQRFQAYKEELGAFGIPYDESLVVEGDFTPESGRAAVHTLMDEREVRFQALMAANDRMAFGALEALQHRRIRVPEDVAVTGFDDSREAQATGVPLTTVRQSFYTAGRRAMEVLLRRIEGGTVPPKTLTPTQLYVRWSCGCLPEIVRQAAVAPRDVARTGRLENKREAALRALMNSAGVAEQDTSLLPFREAFGGAWDAFLLTLRDKASSDDFLKTINAVIELLQRHGVPTAVWHNVLSTMRRYALGGITSHTIMLKAENLFQQARLLAGELSQRSQAYRRLALEQQESVLQSFSFSMAPVMSLEEIGSVISNHFPEMGIERGYVMFYSDVASPHPISAPPPENYHLLFEYEAKRFEIPRQRAFMGTGQLVPHGKTPQDRRYTAVVMPLSLARNRFGFMWIEMGPRDWEVYVRIRNLVSSALLRTMLVQQREQAQQEVERLLTEARDRAVELDIAKEFAERTASENAKLYSSEQVSRRAADALAKAARQLSLLATVAEVPQQIVAQLAHVIPSDRGTLFLEDVNGVPRLLGHRGFPAEEQLPRLKYELNGKNIYQVISERAGPVTIQNVPSQNGWEQPEWHPPDGSWLGIPVYSKNKVTGMLTLSRSAPGGFTQDEILLASTFAVQAGIAIENARLYDEVTRFNQMMERMVEQRVDELNNALSTLEKLDRNKSDFIRVAAHELRTPLTVIKGYMGMIKGDLISLGKTQLAEAVEGVMQGIDRLHQIVNSMLDVVRLENQILTPRLEKVTLAPILRVIQKEYAQDLGTRQINLELDSEINECPPLMADPDLLQKALDNVIVNAVKYTPDGGSISVSAQAIQANGSPAYCEIRVQDTGIGIDPADHSIIFEKLYQLGKVELHSSGKTKFKGGGPGLGLAIAAGIVDAHRGKIWVESPGYDEEKLPGSTFFIQIPLAQ